MSGRPTAAFGAVMRPGTAPALLSVGAPPPGAAKTRPTRTTPARAASLVDYVDEFVAVCTSAIEVAFGEDLRRCDVAPGVAVPAPLPMLLAYLLYVAATAPDDEDPARLADWLQRADRATWTRLGFDAPPSRLHVELAFSLLRERAPPGAAAARPHRARRVPRRRRPAARGARVTAAQAQRAARRRAHRAAKRAQRQAQVQTSAAQRQRNRRHNADAYGLQGATEFSADRLLGDPVEVIRMLRRWAPRACLELIQRTTVQRERGVAGAPRIDGSWGLVFLAHILAGNPDWQNWYDANRSSPLWDACGFDRVPSWQTTYLRFGELEDPRYVAAFTDAANQFIRLAARNEPRALRFFHTDGTPAHSHARLEHACPGQAFCDACTGRKPAKTLARASDEAVNSDRHERSAQPEPDNPDAPPDNRLVKLSDQDAQALGLSDWRRSRYFRFGAGGHVFRCRDKDVGIRSYGRPGTAKKKVWTGGYFLPAICDFFWAPVAVHFFEADIQEHLGWPELYRKTAIALDDDPDHPTRIAAVIADRAWTNKTHIAFNTNRGVASITPERSLPGGRPWSDLRTDRWDEHAPRCQHCGGPSRAAAGPGEGFVLTGTGDPRLRYRCAIGWTADCAKLQSISCRREPRALLPIDRRQRLFHDLLQSHSHFEGIFDSWRDRYAVAGTSQATRSKRRGSIAAQKLRAAAALLAEWFRICLRQGYAGNLRQRNTAQPERRAGGAQRLIKLRTYRQNEGLDLPYGSAATALGMPPLSPTRSPANPPPP